MFTPRSHCEGYESETCTGCHWISTLVSADSRRQAHLQAERLSLGITRTPLARFGASAFLRLDLVCNNSK
jgi:hypothetical protein